MKTLSDKVSGRFELTCQALICIESGVILRTKDTAAIISSQLLYGGTEFDDELINKRRQEM